MADEPTPVIDVNNLVYAFKTQVALQGVTFEVRRGSIHGFVGPNGAGKTTALKILATLLRPQRGDVRLFGTPVTRDQKRLRRRIGFMPDDLGLYRQMTVEEYLDFFAAAYGLRPAERQKTVDDTLSLTDMDGRRSELIKGLSRGMQQRLSLARVLVHDPELLLLDEPASGLDPRARIELMEIFRTLARMGKTIFISSHILSELASLCDSFTIIDRGVVRYSGEKRDLLAEEGRIQRYFLQLREAQSEVEEALHCLDGVREVAKEDGQARYLVSIDVEQAGTRDVLRGALDAGAEITAFGEDEKGLDDVFMDLTEPGVPS